MEPWVGIDLGHTFTRLACRGTGGQLELVPGLAGSRHVPTVAASDQDGSLLFGQPAQRRMIQKVDSGCGDMLQRFAKDSFVSLPTGTVPAADLVAGLLEHCRLSFQAALGRPVSAAVVAVPARWDDAVTQRLLALGARAGLDLTAIDQPVAAVLAAGFDRPLPEPRRVLVLDIGGLQLNASVVSVTDGRLKREALTPRDNVAGVAFTHHIADFVCSRAIQDNGYDLRHDRFLMAELPAKSEAAKLELGRVAWTTIDFGDLERPGGGEPADVEVGILTEDFESMIESSVAEALEAARHATRGAQATDLLLVGGSCQIPFVARQLQKAFEKLHRLEGNPSELVALGAALYASQPPIAVGDAPVAPVAPPAPAAVTAVPVDDTPRVVVRTVEVVETRRELLNHAWLRLDTPLACHSTRVDQPLPVRLGDDPPAELDVTLFSQLPDGSTLERCQSLALPAGTSGEVQLALPVDEEGRVGLRLILPDGRCLEGGDWLPPAPKAPPPRTVERSQPLGVAAGSGEAARYGDRRLLESRNGVDLFRAVDEFTGRNVHFKVYSAANDVARTLFLGNLNLAGIDHPNLARLLDFGPGEGGWWVVTEFDDWVTLRDLTLADGERRRWPANWCVEVVREACAGVAALHERRVCHRNVKPSNIQVRSHGPEVRVSDCDHAASLRGRDLLTDVVGTLPYMSKELIERRADLRADVYALGVVLFELLTGEQPFQAPTQRALMDAIRHAPTPRPSFVDPDLPPHVDRILLKALDKDPDQRHQTAGDLLVDLQTLRFDDEPDATKTVYNYDVDLSPTRKPDDPWSFDDHFVN